MDKRYVFFAFLVAFGLCAFAQPRSIASTTKETQQTQQPSSGFSFTRGIHFIENRGQWADSVLYLTQRNGMDMWILPHAFVYDVHTTRVHAPKTEQTDLNALQSERTAEREGHVFRMNFLGAGATSAEGHGLQKAYYNYFIGNQPKSWASRVPLYSSVQLSALYPGIDAIVYDDGGSPRYDLIVHPGAAPDQIHMSIEGATNWRIDNSGDLQIQTALGTVTHGKLYAYQDIDGKRKQVECRFTTRDKEGNRTLGFAIGNYDPGYTLVIDPLIYSTYIGGTFTGNTDIAHGVQLDAAGYAYATGYTTAAAFPTIGGSYRVYLGTPPNRAGNDVFVAKLQPDGTDLVFLTIVAGSGDDIARDIAIDGSGVYITGYTSSNNFPTTPNALDPTFNGNYDIFITKLTTDGELNLPGTYSTYIGGSAIDKAFAIDVESGSAYITGYSTSLDYPTFNAYDNTGDASLADAIVTKLNAAGAALSFSTFLGGIAVEVGYDIVARAGSAYITGMTIGSIPTTPGAYDRTYNGLQLNSTIEADAFVAKLTNNSLDCSTFFGGTAFEQGTGIAVDGNGDIYIIGSTSSDEITENFPLTTNPFDNTFNGGGAAAQTDAFVAKFNSTLSELLYSTYLGGGNIDFGQRLSLSGNDIVYGIGVTYSPSMATYPDPGAYFRTNQGGVDLFFFKLSTLDGGATDLQYATFFGGYSDDGEFSGNLGINLQTNFEAALPSVGLAHLVVNNRITVAGLTQTSHTATPPFPLSPGAFDNTFNGTTDAFVTQFELDQDRIIVTSPITPITKCAGDFVDITWTATTGIKRVLIDLSNSSGAFTGGTPVSDITLSPPSPYTWRWNIPTGIAPGTYKLQVRDYSNGTIVSTTAIITVKAPPVITTQPQDVYACLGTPVNIPGASATGTDLTYSWYRADNPPPAAPVFTTTTPAQSLALGNATLAMNGTQYFVVVSNDVCAAATSNTVTVYVKMPPTVTGPSVTTLQLCAGQSTTLTISTTGTGVTVTWQYQRIGFGTWDTYPSSTNGNILYLNSVQRGLSGSKIRAEVSNECGLVYSTIVDLTVNWAPELYSDPQIASPVCEGDNLQITGLSYGGSPTPTVQWKVVDKSGNPVTGILPNPTADELHGPAVQAAWDGYTFYATLTNTCGIVTTASVTLQVLAKPTILPSTNNSFTLCEGEHFEKTFNATGASLSYEWYKVGDGAPVATQKTLVFDPVSPSQAGQYYVVVRNTVCPSLPWATSATVTLIVRTKPRITQHPQPPLTLICTGATYSVTALATGTSATFQWQKYNNQTGLFDDIAGANSTTYTIPSVQASDAGRYRMVATGICAPNTTSQEAVLEVGIAPAISSNPANTTICEDENAQFTVGIAPSTNPDPIIYWEVSSNGGSSWSTIATLAFPNTQLDLSTVSAGMNGYLYRAKLVNTCDSVLSTPARLTVNTKPVVQTSPINQTVCEDEETFFDITIDPGIRPDPIIYWEVSTDNGASWSTVATLTFPTTRFNISTVSAGMNGYLYRAKLVNTCDSVLSTPARLTVNTKPVVQTSPINQTVCEGEETFFDITIDPNTRPDPIIYWEVSTDNGASWSTVATLTFPTTRFDISTVSAGMNGYLYRAKLVNTCDSVLSTPAQLTVNTKPVVQTSPINQTVCEDEETFFDITIDPGIRPDPIIYWEVSTDNGASWSTVATLTFPTTRFDISTVSAGMNGYLYRAKLVNICDSVLSTPAQLTVNTKPVVQTSPINQTVCEDEGTFFDITIDPNTRPDPIIYWEVSTDNGASWSTVATLTFPTTRFDISTVSAGMNGYLYRAKLVNICDSVLSTPAQLTVNTKPVVQTSPINQTVCEGESTFFNVAANPSTKPDPIIYWEVSTDNGASWSTVATLTFPTTRFDISTVSAGMNGYLYRAKLVNTCDSVLSTPAQLTVNTKPVVQTSPINQTVCEGEGTFFDITIDPNTRPDPIIYWEVSTDNGASWSTVATLTFPTTRFDISSVSPGMNGYLYRAKLINTCDSVLSTPAQLTVNTKPVVQTSPTDQTVCEGESTSFNVVVAPSTKPNPIIYWEVSTDNGASWSTVATLSFPTTQLDISTVSAGMNGYLYRAKLVNTCDSALSGIAKLIVNTRPVVRTSPEPKIVCEGESTYFSVEVAPTTKPDPLIYWEVSTDNGGSWSTVATLVFPNTRLDVSNVTASMNGSLYRAVITNTCGTAVSTAALLTVQTKPAVVISPANAIICEGNSVSFEARATGSPSPTIAWEYSTDGTSYTAITDNGQYIGATTNTLTISNISPTQDGYYFRAVFSNECGKSTSAVAILTVKTLPNITLRPTSATVCVGQPYIFTVEATGSNLHYQWQKDGNDIPNASGAHYTTFTIPAVTEGDAAVYTVVVSGYCPPAVATSATLNVNAPPTISAPPQSTTVCEGNDVQFSVTATGANISYQWYKDGVAITGATYAVLSLSSVDVSDAGQYYVEVHGICPVTPATSAIAVLTVNTSPKITNEPLSRSVCEGETVIFSVGVTGTAPQFQWRKNGQQLLGETGRQLTLSDITQADAGTYDVIVSGACPPAVISTIATLVVNAAPQITQDPRDTIICEGETLVLTVNATGAGRTFQWRKNGIDILTPEGTSQNYTLPSITDADNGLYDVIVSGTCTPADTSIQALVRVQIAPRLVTTASFPVVQCAGGFSRDTLLLSNPGVAPVAMNAATVNNPRFTVISPVGPFTIPAGGSAEVIVEFRPVRAGVEIAAVNMTTERCNSQILASISARADSVHIASLPEVRFKSVAQCDGPDVQEVLVENTGDVEVRVTPSFTDPQFTLDNPSDSPIVLPAGASKRVRVRFTSNGTPNTAIVAVMRLITEQCNIETLTTLRAGSIRTTYQAVVPGGILDFGTLAGCKSSSSLTFQIRNTGNAVVSITSATTTNPAFGVVLPQTPLLLGVGSTATISVQFGAGPPGPVAGTLVLRSGLPCPQDTTFDLRGNRGDVAIAPDIQAVSYGKFLSCEQTSRDTVIVITNNGTEDAAFALPDVQAPFALVDVQPTPGFPRTIKAGASVRVRIAFSPAADGSYTSAALFPYKWGECTDTLRIPLSGAVSTPQLQANLTTIDFGALLGCEGSRDTTITLVNNGSDDMFINDIQDPTGYRIKDLLPSSLPLMIPANGGTIELRIRFAPTSPGVYAQSLVLTAQPCNVQLNIALRGEKQGVSFSDVPGAIIDFDTIVNCGTLAVPPKTFAITNTSDGNVQGRVSYTITGPFATTLQQNTLLPPGSPVSFDVSFVPTGNGSATGELKLFYEPCGITRTIALRGAVTSVALVNNGAAIFSDQTVNTTSGQRVALFTNSGSTSLTVTAIEQPDAPFTVESITPPLPAVLGPGESLTVVLTFTPTDDVDYKDTLRVVSKQPCDVSSMVTVEGRGTNAPQPNITFKGVDFGPVYVTMSRTLKVRIENDGQDDGQIFSIISDDPQFTVEPLTMPQLVRKDEFIDVEVTFTPTSPGIKTTKLKILSDGGSPEDILRGEGIPLPEGKTVLAMPALTAEAGTANFAVPVRLVSQQDLELTQSISSLKFDVSFNGTLFYPTSTSKGSIIANSFDAATHIRTITVELSAADFAGIPANGDVLVELFGNVLLGDNETTDLQFSNIVWEVGLGTAVTAAQHGKLTLTNVCRVGGARLIKLNKAHSITSMTPNPASDAVEIVAEVPVVGPAVLEIYSLTGELVYSHRWMVSRSSTTDVASTATVLVVPTNNLPNGVYQVVLRSKERVDSERLIIVK